MRNRGAKTEDKVTMRRQRRDLEIGTRVSSFLSRERAPSRLPFLIGKRGNREVAWTRPHIPRMIAIRRESGILVYRAARGDFRSIKVTSISCLIRSRSKSPEKRSEIFIAWRLINGNSQMLALHIFLDYFKNARYDHATDPRVNYRLLL